MGIIDARDEIEVDTTLVLLVTMPSVGFIGEIVAED